MQRYITDDDVRDYGRDLVDFTQRAAIDAVSPKFQQIEAQNQELQARLARESRHRLDSQVEAAIPNWRQLDQDPDWHRWLLGIDSLSGRQRQQLLNEAKAASDAARCVHFFRSFFARPRPAVGGGAQATYSQAPSSRRASAPNGPIYTRDQVKKLYRQHQQGAYRGREAEWARQEVDICRASGEGRIVGGVDVAGK